MAALGCIKEAVLSLAIAMTATLTPSLAICQDQTTVVVGNQSVYCPSYFGLPVGGKDSGRCEVECCAHASGIHSCVLV